MGGARPIGVRLALLREACPPPPPDFLEAPPPAAPAPSLEDAPADLPWKLASTKVRMVRTQSRKLCGVMWATSRTRKARDSQHLRKERLSCMTRGR